MQIDGTLADVGDGDDAKKRAQGGGGAPFFYPPLGIEAQPTLYLGGCAGHPGCDQDGGVASFLGEIAAVSLHGRAMDAEAADCLYQFDQVRLVVPCH